MYHTCRKSSPTALKGQLSQEKHTQRGMWWVVGMLHLQPNSKLGLPKLGHQAIYTINLACQVHWLLIPLAFILILMAGRKRQWNMAFRSGQLLSFQLPATRELATNTLLPTIWHTSRLPMQILMSFGDPAFCVVSLCQRDQSSILIYCHVL